jgi:hypothetical protein
MSRCGRLAATLTAALGLAICLAAWGRDATAETPSLYRSATRYPYPVPAQAGTLAAAAAADPGHRRPVLNLPEVETEEDEASLLPGFRQLKTVEPDSRAASGPSLLATPPPDQEFDTVPDTGSVPPDSAIAANATHLVCAGNDVIQVRTLAGELISTTPFESFFPLDQTRHLFDPRLCYDPDVKRFIFACLGRRENPALATCLLAVSKSTDPTAGWNKYLFNVGRGGSPPTELSDYTALGYDQRALYVSMSMFDAKTHSQTGNRLLLLDKFRAATGGALQPFVVDDVTLPRPPFVPVVDTITLRPVEADESVDPGLMVASAAGVGLALYKVTDPLGRVGAPKITGSFIDTTDFARPGDAPQQGAGPPLDTMDDRLQKTVFRNGEIWTCQNASSTGAAGGKSEVRFYRINPAGNGALVDADVISSPSLHFFYPAIMPDLFGNAVAVFQGSNASSFASLYHARYDGARHSFDAPLLTEPGLSTYREVDDRSRNRFGDYTDACLDRLFPTSVWVQGELPVTATTWKLHAAQVFSTPPPGPLAPSGLTATAGPGRAVFLKWQDNSVNETRFIIERKTGASAFSQVGTVGPNVTTFTDLNVAFATAYTYQVRAANAGGTSAPSNPVTVTTPAGSGRISVSPSSWSVRQARRNHRFSKRFRIRNLGTTPLFCTIKSPAAPFSSSASSFGVAPRKSRTFTVSFQSSTTGSFRDAVTINSSDPPRPVVLVRLSARVR